LLIAIAITPGRLRSFGWATSRRHKRDLLSAAAIVRLCWAGVNAA